MTKLEAVAASKQFRKDADALLQRMKEHKRALMIPPSMPVGIDCEDAVPPWGDDQGESIAQHTLSIRDLESCIMRQGMALKYIGNPNPYPESYNPASPVVEPTADGLEL